MTSGAEKPPDAADYGEQLRAQLRNRSVLLFVTLASIGDAVIMTDSDGDITFLNPAAEALTGWKLEEAPGLRIEEVFALVEEESGAPVENPVRKALATVSKVHLSSDALLRRKDGKCVPIDDSAAPILGVENEVLGAVLVFRDITDRKKAERLIKYRSQLDKMVAETSTAFVISPVSEVDSLIDGALDSISKFFRADRAYVFLYNRSESTMVCTHEYCAEGVQPLKGITIPTSSVPYWTQMMLERKHIRMTEDGSVPEEALAQRALWERQGVKALLAVPIAQEDRVLGFIGMESVNKPRPWLEETVDTLLVFGNIFANAMGRRDSQRKLEAAREREVEIGARIQQTLLLSSPPATSTDFEVAATTIPSRGVDGDFYDFLLHPDRSLDVIFGDVMGKGVPAALLSAGAKTEFLRSLSHLLVSSSRGSVPQPADIVNSVHSVLTPQLMNLDSFVTLTYARFNPQSYKAIIVDCGNTRLLRYVDGDGHVECLSGFNLPLGFSASEVYEEAIFSYAVGDIFLLYSDGVTEARNSEGVMFGRERLEKLLSDKHLLSPQLIVEATRDAVIDYIGSSVLADDLTCVCIKIPPGYSNRTPPASGEVEITSSLSELSAIRAFLRGFCEQRSACHMDRRDLHMLELAVTEVASNIIKHSYHRRVDQHIWVRMSMDEDLVKVRLTHTGEEFSGSPPVSPPSLEGGKEGGFGLFIISRSVDDIEYGQDDDGRSYVELSKSLRKRGGKSHAVSE